jgi:hypothetical protein
MNDFEKTDEIMVLYVLSFGVILLFFFFVHFVAKEDGLFTYCLIESFLFGLPLCTYILLFFTREIRLLAWIFPIFGLLCFVFFWFCICAEWMGLIKYSGLQVLDSDSGLEQTLLSLYGMACPLLLSSCVANWILASCRVGKVVFLTVLGLFMLMMVQLSIASKNGFYLLAILWLMVFAWMLYRWPVEWELSKSNDKPPESEA